MNKFPTFIMFFCLLFVFSFGIAAQERPKKKEQIATNVKNENVNSETDSEAKTESSERIALEKEYSEILPDNSYLVEIANNIEAGNLHSIVSCTQFRNGGKDLVCGATQEFSIKDGRHLFSYTAPYSFLDETRVRGVGDVALTYRYQMTTDKDFAVVSPRFSLLLPSGKRNKELGTGSTGFQFNLPVTKRLSNAFLGNFNAGMTFLPKIKGEDSDGNLVKRNLTSFNLGGSLIWVAHRNINPLVEYVENFSSEINENGRVTRFNEHIVSPGVGLGWQFKHFKLSPGFAVPVSFSGGNTRTGFLFYIGVEHVFFKKKTQLQTAENDKTTDK